MNEFKDMLKFFRMREHLSQRELASKLGISTSEEIESKPVRIIGKVVELRGKNF